MPPLTLHIAIARSVAERLRDNVLDDERGSLYLGSTAPDIRVITRWDRSRTHFFDLEELDEQDGVSKFFAAHPALSQPAKLTPETAAFVAGYLTHLVMDETWINMVYRPHFGRSSPLGGSLKANVMDRALQFSLDSDRRNDAELVAHVTKSVACHELGLEVGFIDLDTLRRWHGVVLDMIAQAPDWERFRHGARRHLGDAEAQSDEFEELVRSLPDLVDETLRYLSPELVDTFMCEALDKSAASVREYFACA
jgi:hypothetical protein